MERFYILTMFVSLYGTAPWLPTYLYLSLLLLLLTYHSDACWSYCCCCFYCCCCCCCCCCCRRREWLVLRPVGSGVAPRPCDRPGRVALSRSTSSSPAFWTLGLRRSPRLVSCSLILINSPGSTALKGGADSKGEEGKRGQGKKVY